MYSIMVVITLLFCGCVSYVKLGSSTRLDKITHKDMFRNVTRSHKDLYTKITYRSGIIGSGVALNNIKGIYLKLHKGYTH